MSAMRRKKVAIELPKQEPSKAVETLEPKPVKEKKAAAPRKAAVKKPAAKKEAFNPNVYVVVDHPQQNEVISGLHYAIRLGASDNGAVELSIDGGDWQPCRQAAGYWWFDWGYFTAGSHALVARLRDAEGKTLKKTAAINVKIV